MTIYQLLSPKNILLELEVDYKFDAINALVDTFVDVIENELLEEIREAIISREKIMSTGIGQGLAIPHGKTDAITQNYAAFARLKEPIEFNSIDSKPVQLIFLMVSPYSDQRSHIRLLSRVSTLMNYDDFRSNLLIVPNQEDLVELFKQKEFHQFNQNKR
ncbi:MAG: PTS sugar transporter subunit IIA [Bacteroidota bacterium]|nr:PTS sugar transporter subunit IIA [Bacteroidota bacterium]